MPRFLLDLEVESQATLAAGTAALLSDSPALGVSVSVIQTDERLGTTTLSMQLTLDAGTLHDARDRGLDIAKDLLRAWSFTTSMPFRVKVLRSVVDWTPGLREREGILFTHHPANGGPHPVLDVTTFQSAVRVLGAPLSVALRRAIRWFSNGVSSDYLDDQFYHFWLAAELIAIETKAPDPVHDACSKCRGPLYCQACNTHPKHRPYPKQAIQALFRRHITDTPEDFFAYCDRYRNALMHGEDVESIEECSNVKFENVVNSLGKLVWAALLSVTLNKMAASGESGELPVLETNLFVNHHLRVGLNLIVTSRDPDRPSLSDLPSFEVSLHAHPQAT